MYLQDGIVLLVIVCFTPSEGKGHPLYLCKNSVADRPMKFNDYLAMLQEEQNLDSFPNLGGFDRNAHKIVKKQMTPADYMHALKNKKSAIGLRKGSSGGPEFKFVRKTSPTVTDFASGDAFRRKRESPALAIARVKTNPKINGGIMYRRGLMNLIQKKKKGAATKQGQEKEIIEETTPVMPLELEQEAVIPPVAETIVPPVKAASKIQAEESEKAEEKKFEKKMEEKNKQAVEKALEKTKAKANEIEKMIKNKARNKDLEANEKILEEECKMMKGMVGCKMENYCRFPDVQDNTFYFECESDENGCIKLVHKRCPDVEREKRSLWKNEQKQRANPWMNGQTSSAWTDVTREDTRQFPPELRSRNRPKLIVYHVKVKKDTNEQIPLERKERRGLGMAHSIHMGRRQKVAGLKSKHQLLPRSFAVHINKKEGRCSHKESLSEDRKNDADDEEDDEEDDEDGEDTSEDDVENDNEKKNAERSGIKEFFKSAKDAITNRARISEPADATFTLDKTNSYSKTKNLDESENESKTVLIDADIKVDKALGTALKKVLGKRKDEFSISDRGSRDFLDPDVKAYENLIKTNPRLKRYFFVFHDETGN